MEPKTKAQKAIAAIQVRLPRITDAQRIWARQHCLAHEGVRLKSGQTTCLDCAYVWYEALEAWKLNVINETVCPGCCQNLKIIDTRKQKFTDWAYFHVITTFEGWQVIRLYKISAQYFSGIAANIGVMEIGQMWMSEKKCFDFGLYQGFSGNWCGNIELRAGAGGGYGFDCKIYPIMHVLPVLKQRGFSKSFHGLYPFRIFKMLLTESFAETLIKAKYYGLLRHFSDHYERRKLNEYWPSIKIALRNKYVIKDAGLWIDYLALLQHFGKDMRNQKYVCPENLRAMHDRYVVKKEASDKKEALAARRERIEQEQRDYERSKLAFFGMEFATGSLVIKVIDNVEGFAEEGRVHKHCVYTNEYYKKPESLVLSATVDGHPMETIEVSLTDFKILQARGFGNKATEYHDDIINLVNKNMKLIKRASKVA